MRLLHKKECSILFWSHQYLLRQENFFVYSFRLLSIEINPYDFNWVSFSWEVQRVSWDGKRLVFENGLTLVSSPWFWEVLPEKNGEFEY
jgi:hypothetical protein